jgi:DNA-binding GntR family transcriptional regulator
MIQDVNFKSLTEQVYEHLSDLIIEGKLKPGEKLIETDLCHQFKISRSPIRECLRILESEGLVTITPRRGTYVRELTRKDIEEFFPVRASLESLAVKIAIPHIGEKEIGMLNDLTLQMEKALEDKNLRSFVPLNFSFHSMIIKNSRNQVLEKTLKTLGKGFWLRMASMYYQSPLGLKVSNDMHRQIVQALAKRDVGTAQRLLEEHIDHAKHDLLQSMPEKAMDQEETRRSYAP